MKSQSPTRLHVDLDLSDRRRVFACGDVHGHLRLLLDRMEAHGYDGAAGDVLISLGDWIDRGPDALAIRDLLASDPSILWVRGNHEEMLAGSVAPSDARTRDAARRYHVRYGGEWIVSYLDDEDRIHPEIEAFSAHLNSAPVAYRVLTPGGRTVGLVHADVAAESWDDMARALNGPEPARKAMAAQCMWSKTRADRILSGQGRFCDLSVPGVDQVFLGHTIAGTVPVRHRNVTLLDTGSFATGVVTMVDVDAWLAGPSAD